MAKKATAKAKNGGKGGSKSRAVVARGADRRQSGGRRSSDSASEAFVNLLQSPLVAELVAVAATAALTALAQEGIGGDSSRKKRAGNAVKRNRLRRVVRESFRLAQHGLPGVDVVVAAKFPAAQAPVTSLRDSLATLWKRVASTCASS